MGLIPAAMEGFPFVFLLLILLTGLTFTVLVDPYIRREQRRMMLIVVALIVSLVIQNFTGYLLDVYGTFPFPRTLVAVCGYAVRPVILVLLGCIVSKRWRVGFAWIIVGINAGIYMTAAFSLNVAFSIDGNNTFHRGPLGYSCHIVSAILLLYLAYVTVQEYRVENKVESWIPFFNVVTIFISVILDTFAVAQEYPVSFLTITVVSSNIFYYIWMHLQFVREHEKGLQTEQRIQIMMTQIQPHFLYNTLMTIQALCRIDPAQAYETTGMFSRYLRQNLETLDQPHLIPVQKELEHTKIYAEIEMIRFSNIQVCWKIENSEFSLPALTIQPIVENAIRHGVRIREKGIVTVRTRQYPKGYEIVIEDNGIGFDPEKVVLEGKNHIGIRNVRERIETMCSGTLDIQSRIGEGTKVTIRIPFQFQT